MRTQTPPPLRPYASAGDADLKTAAELILRVTETIAIETETPGAFRGATVRELRDGLRDVRLAVDELIAVVAVQRKRDEKLS